MNCIFCKMPLNMESLLCISCPINVQHTIHRLTNKLMAVQMQVELNNKTIEVYIALESFDGLYCSISEITKATVNKTFTGITKLSSRLSIMHLEGIPNINPINIQDKLKTYLIFS